MKKPQIIAEDDSIVVVNKPAGWLSIPGRYDKERVNIFDYLKKKRAALYTVHRIDKDTSGVLCFAKTAAAHKHLNQQFEHRKIEKIYVGIVQGRVEQDEGELDYPIAADPQKPGKMRVYAKGKSATTHFRVLERFQRYTYLELRPVTGRTHQLRIHLAYYAHPLIIDPLYHTSSGFYLSVLKGKKYKLGKNNIEKPLLNRTPLHAQCLTVLHPDTQEIRMYAAPLPKDMKAVLRQLRQHI